MTEETEGGGARGGILVLGLGNDFMADDAVGLHVARAIQARLCQNDPVTVRESPQMGFALLDELTGFDLALLIDAVRTGLEAPGHVHVLDTASLRALPVTSPHFAGIGEMMALGRCLDLGMPQEIRVLAIETADPFTFSTRMTEELEERLDGIVETVWSEVNNALALMAGSSPSRPCRKPRAALEGGSSVAAARVRNPHGVPGDLG